jgi:hypothetical protein
MNGFRKIFPIFLSQYATFFAKIAERKVVPFDEFYYQLKLMHLFQKHPVLSSWNELRSSGECEQYATELLVGQDRPVVVRRRQNPCILHRILVGVEIVAPVVASCRLIKFRREFWSIGLNENVCKCDAALAEMVY